MSEKVRKLIKEYVIPYTALITVLILVFRYAFYFIIVPTGSMMPTIDEWSLLFSTRVYNIPENLKRGDIVVFESDELNSKWLVKRLIGLPGEKIVIDDMGEVSIDGQPIEESYVKHYSPKSGEFEVPEGCYFFLGDNRSGSYDARSWENPYIPESKIRGKARFTIWPVSNFGMLK